MSKEHIFMYYLVLFTMLVAPAFACNTITQERERGTLDLLLTTLLRPHQIITGKFIACMRLSIFLTGLVGVTMAFYVAVGNDPAALRAAYLLVYLAILLIAIVFETSLAMFFSLLFRSTFHSMITTYTVLLVLFAAPVAANVLLESFTKMQRGQMFLMLVLSPFEAVYSVSMKTAGSMTLRENDVMVWGSYLLLYLGLSVILMCYVYSAFERKSLETRKIE
jgi:ABC-type transport system involved in multi-copper enzyme maturation permease subunit